MLRNHDYSTILNNLTSSLETINRYNKKNLFVVVTENIEILYSSIELSNFFDLMQIKNKIEEVQPSFRMNINRTFPILSDQNKLFILSSSIVVPEKIYLFTLEFYSNYNLMYRCLKRYILSYQISTPIHKISLINALTTRQYCICWLLAYNFTNEEISSIISPFYSNTSRGGVNNIVGKLRFKFDCHSKKHLITFLLHNGIHENIPMEFASQFKLKINKPVGC